MVAVGVVVVCQWLNLEYSFPKVWATIARIGERWSLFSPQDMILLLNTCQEDIIQRSKMFKRTLHVQSHIHKNNYEDLLTQIVLCEYSGLTKCNVETFTAILKFRKNTPQLFCCKNKVHQNSAYHNPDLQTNIPTVEEKSRDLFRGTYPKYCQTVQDWG